MPITEIVRIDEIDACVERTILGIRDGLVKLREKGITAEYPEKVDFQMLVVKEFNALQIEVGAEKSVQAQTENSTATERQQTAGSDTSFDTESGRTDAANSHTQNTDSQQDTYE